LLAVLLVVLEQPLVHMLLVVAAVLVQLELLVQVAAQVALVCLALCKQGRHSHTAVAAAGLQLRVHLALVAVAQELCLVWVAREL
jgi:hypothetical protein